MSVFQKIFGSPAPAPAPAPAAPGVTNNLNNNPAPPAPHSSSTTDPNGVVPPGAADKPEPTPIDKFSKVWETDPDNSNKPPADGGLTPEKMLEAAGKVDFSRVLDQESLQKITAGGEGAVEALAGLLNKTAQTVYGQSTVVAKKLVDQAVEQAEARFAAQVPNLVKRQSMRDGLVSENPAFNHPAVAPIVEVLQQQMAQKHPNATATELQSLAKEYFAAAAGVLSPQKKAAAAPGAGEVDWDSYVQS